MCRGVKEEAVRDANNHIERLFHVTQKSDISSIDNSNRRDLSPSYQFPESLVHDWCRKCANARLPTFRIEEICERFICPFIFIRRIPLRMRNPDLKRVCGEEFHHKLGPNATRHASRPIKHLDAL